MPISGKIAVADLFRFLHEHPGRNPFNAEEERQLAIYSDGLFAMFLGTRPALFRKLEQVLLDDEVRAVLGEAHAQLARMSRIDDLASFRQAQLRWADPAASAVPAQLSGAYVDFKPIFDAIDRAVASHQGTYWDDRDCRIGAKGAWQRHQLELIRDLLTPAVFQKIDEPLLRAFLSEILTEEMKQVFLKIVALPIRGHIPDYEALIQLADRTGWRISESDRGALRRGGVRELLKGEPRKRVAYLARILMPEFFNELYKDPEETSALIRELCDYEDPPFQTKNMLEKIARIAAELDKVPVPELPIAAPRAAERVAIGVEFDFSEGSSGRRTTIYEDPLEATRRAARRYHTTAWSAQDRPQRVGGTWRDFEPERPDWVVSDFVEVIARDFSHRHPFLSSELQTLRVLKPHQLAGEEIFHVILLALALAPDIQARMKDRLPPLLEELFKPLDPEKKAALRVMARLSQASGEELRFKGSYKDLIEELITASAHFPGVRLRLSGPVLAQLREGRTLTQIMRDKPDSWPKFLALLIHPAVLQGMTRTAVTVVLIEILNSYGERGFEALDRAVKFLPPADQLPVIRFKGEVAAVPTPPASAPLVAAPVAENDAPHHPPPSPLLSPSAEREGEEQGATAVDFAPLLKLQNHPRMPLRQEIRIFDQHRNDLQTLYKDHIGIVLSLVGFLALPEIQEELGENFDPIAAAILGSDPQGDLLKTLERLLSAPVSSPEGMRYVPFVYHADLVMSVLTRQDKDALETGGLQKAAGNHWCPHYLARHIGLLSYSFLVNELIEREGQKYFHQLATDLFRVEPKLKGSLRRLADAGRPKLAQAAPELALEVDVESERGGGRSGSQGPPGHLPSNVLRGPWRAFAVNSGAAPRLPAMARLMH